MSDDQRTTGDRRQQPRRHGEIERTLPHNLDAEKAVLGAILLKSELYLEIADLVTARDFFRDAHRRIFAQIAQLTQANQTVDPLTVKDALLRAGDLDEVGGPAYIYGLTDGVPRFSNVTAYATIVRERSRLRDAIAAGSRIVSEAYEAEDDAAEVLNRAEQALYELTAHTVPVGPRMLREILSSLMDRMEAWSKSAGGITGVPSGFTELDYHTGGFQPEDMIILGARPSMGKSALALNIAEQAARRGFRPGVWSLEMREEALAVRALAGASGVNSHRIQTGRLYESDWAKLTHAIGELSELPIAIDASSHVSVQELRSRARRLKAKQGLDLILVDYAQLMAGEGENRQLEIAGISRGLKGIARLLKVPIIVLSQLSRDLEKRTDKRPVLSDLRESGSLEQDADTVMFLYRPEVYEGENVKPEHVGYAELLIAKQRNGPTGMVPLTWDKYHQQFMDRDTTPQPEDQRLPMGDR